MLTDGVLESGSEDSRVLFCSIMFHLDASGLSVRRPLAARDDAWTELDSCSESLAYYHIPVSVAMFGEAGFEIHRQWALKVVSG